MKVDELRVSKASIDTSVDNLKRKGILKNGVAKN